MHILEIVDLHASIEGKKVLNGINLKLTPGKVHVIMGPNGSGKSSLAHVLMGHPKFSVTGCIRLDSDDITQLSPDARARSGLFLSFQHPQSVSGVSVTQLLKSAVGSISGKTPSALLFRKELEKEAKKLCIDPSFLDRSINEGFSGGEKKKIELLQLLTLQPKLAILDEIDSGLDIDALKIVAQGAAKFVDEKHTLLVITHYKRLLHYLKPDHIYILKDGKIKVSGGPELVDRLEDKGYDWIEEGPSSDCPKCNECEDRPCEEE